MSLNPLDLVSQIRQELDSFAGAVSHFDLLKEAEEVITRLVDQNAELADVLEQTHLELSALRTELDYLECRLEVDTYGEDPFYGTSFEDLVA